LFRTQIFDTSKSNKIPADEVTLTAYPPLDLSRLILRISNNADNASQQYLRMNPMSIPGTDSVQKMPFMDEPKCMIRNMKIIILDDGEEQILVLESTLKRAGFQNLYTLSDPSMIVEVFEREKPDLLLLDFKMPKMSGLDVIRILQKKLLPNTFFPMLVLTADCRSQTKEEMLQAGAKDFLTKPYSVTEVILRVQHLLEARCYYLELQHQKDNLEVLVKEQTGQLEGKLTRLAKV
jgi:CheY-like chemotaxis protein